MIVDRFKPGDRIRITVDVTVDEQQDPSGPFYLLGPFEGFDILLGLYDGTREIVSIEKQGPGVSSASL